MGTTNTITMQSLGKIAQCAPAVGAKMWCLFFRDVNTRVLGYPGPVWPTRVPTRVP